MQAGENTLDALITRLLTKSLTKFKSLDTNDFRSSYISFMTTPGSHNDTYAGTCHRMFFKNFVNGIPPEDCPDNDSHNVDAIDALMTVPPIVLSHLKSSREERNTAIRNSIHVTRRTEAVLPYANLYADMLQEIILNGRSIPEVAQAAGKKMKFDVASEVSRSYQDPMVACYISSAFPAMLFMAYKYGDDYESLVLSSANAGGENVARGSLLGALAGAKFGLSGTPDRFKNGLVLGNEYLSECEEFVSIFGFSDDSGSSDNLQPESVIKSVERDLNVN
jgi:ADP-ribosylglycohydrolase